MASVSQDEFDRVVALVESKTCFRFTAGTRNPDSTAFMVPVHADGETPMDGPVEFTWDQLVAMSELPEPPQ